MEGLWSVIIFAVFVLALFFMGLPSKVSRLEHKIKKLDKKLKGGNQVSKIFEELVGKECKISFSFGINDRKYKILEVDEDWIKASYTDDKKQKMKTEIIRIDEIDKIEIL